MKHQYLDHKFSAPLLSLVGTMNAIVDEYVAQGYRLTVRQLYYQLVARDHVENTLRSYKRVASAINDAKMAGLMDWEAIEDRTREFIRRSRWDSRSHILRSVGEQFHMDLWAGQPCRIFVVVEKEALVGVLEPTCNKYDVPLLAARGYPSGTVIHEFTESDIVPTLEKGQRVVLLHLGDHDPSGIDMTRDLTDRIRLFVEDPIEGSGLDSSDIEAWDLTRIALNRDQIAQYKPPPNPAKATDARFKQYAKVHGRSSWELDALRPEVLAELLESNILKHVDSGVLKARTEEILENRERLMEIADEEEATE